MADLGEQPEGKVLSLDPKGQEATGNGIGKLGSIVLSDRRCARPRYGGVVVITEFLTRLRFLILRRDRTELEQELQFHIEQSIASKRVSGLSGQSTMVHNCDLVENNPEQLNCISFQVGFLRLFGISPALGRNFQPEEDRPNGAPAVMISYGLWKSHYGGDPHILERTINVDGSPRRVVGVLPRDFQFPTLETADIVFPMALNSAIQQTVNGGFGNPMRVFARLKPGVGVAKAYAEMQPIFESELHVFPAEARKEGRLSIRSLRDRESKDPHPP